MNFNESDYELGSQTLREIERLEELERNRQQADVIGSSQNHDEIVESQEIFESSFEHKSLSDRFRLATQMQNDKRKFSKTKSESTLKDPGKDGKRKSENSFSLSRLIRQDIENLNTSKWERSMEKLISPFNQSKRNSFKPDLSKLTAVQEEKNTESDHHDFDNVTFIEPQRSDSKLYQGTSQQIEEELISRHTQNYEDEWEPVDNSKYLMSQSISRVNQSLKLDVTKDLNLITSWNLPQSTVNEYQRKGVERIFDWQSECLQNPKVLFEGANLVFSAPTSAGKTLVSEILMIKNVLERRKKAIFILPFVSIVREKITYLQELLTSSGIKVDGYYGGYYPARGFDSLDIIVGTYEKAHSIINRMLEENRLDEVGMIVIDEIHSISDSQRGYILELLLTKVLFMCNKFNYQIQLVGMSATLPNVDLLCQWLKAEIYTTNFRPVELKEMIKIEKTILSHDFKFIRRIKNEWSSYFPIDDSDDIFELVMETINENYQLIIFCATKIQCESLCKSIAHGVSNVNKKMPERIASIFNIDRIKVLLAQGESLASGFDNELKRCLNYGCAFHHAGLTTEERELVEIGFKTGTIKLLVATSTLSAGVNLPSRRVIIRSPLFMNEMMDNIKYQQMIGRAGRKGQDTLGESILVCNKQNEAIGRKLIRSSLKPIQSCLDCNQYVHLKRAILEIIASNMANTREDLENFVNQTLFCQKEEISFEYLKQTTGDEFKAIASSQKKFNDIFDSSEENDPIKSSMNFLLKFEFIRLHQSDDGDDLKFVPTKLGLACLSSSLSPREGFMLFQELIRARQNFVLEGDLHAIYLVTPFSITHQLDIDWTHFEDLYDKLPSMMKRVGEMVGISAQFFIKAMRGRNLNDDLQALAVHKRFYIALALQDLVDERPIAEVSERFKIGRATLQTLQQSASAFAATVTNFCESLEWNLMVLILKQFRQRLFFGIHPDLIELMKIPSITSTKIARALYKAKIRNLKDLAIARKVQVEDVLIGIAGTNKIFMGIQADETSVHDAARILIKDAQNFVQSELGVKGVKWSETQASEAEPMPSKFKSPGNVSKIVESTPQSSKSSSIENRKRKSMDISANLVTPQKRSKLLEENLSYKRKLRSSTSKTDIHEAEPENDSQNSQQEISYENVSLFNNPGISLDESDLLPIQTSVDKFLEITEVTETNLKAFKTAIDKEEVSVSIGVSLIQSKVATIGGNVLRAQKSSEKFIFKEKFYISCMSFCCDGNKVFYLDLQDGKWTEVLRRIFSKSDITFCMYESKENLKILNETEICTNFDEMKTKDPKIAAWFTDPDMSFKWSAIVEKFLQNHAQIFDLIPQHHNSSSSIGLDYRFSVSPKDRTAIEAFIVKELLKAQKMNGTQPWNKSQTATIHMKIFQQLEMPIQKILAKMEIFGFPVDNRKLHEMIENCIVLKKNLEDYIYKLHGSRFDITNKSVVAKVVGIHKENGKKMSTAKEVLAKIDLPIARCISTFRTLSTTIANLQPMTKIVHDGRVHGSSFSLTQTGRISMFDPNLQNVTKDFVVEYEDSTGNSRIQNVSFRSAFRCKPGKVLISADFCQLELRILTHLCKDTALTATMEKPNDDIFKQIAAGWNKIAESAVTDKLRNQTKQLCYGVIYGMGVKALAQKMDVDESEAKKIVDDFHVAYPTIKKYTNTSLEKAKLRGYIETVTVRRRYLPAINSEDMKESRKAERQAFNSIIQGSASDLVKNAIVTMEKALRKKKFKDDECVLVLHLHDELFYEVKESKSREAINILIDSMENCVKLRVPLRVKVKTGRSWGEMEEVKRR